MKTKELKTRKATARKHDYFTFIRCQHMDGHGMETCATIYTMSAINHLLAKEYDPFLDQLRRTWVQNHTAELWRDTVELELHNNRTQKKAHAKAVNKRKDVRELANDLLNIGLSTAQREELDAEYFTAKAELEELEELEANAHELAKAQREDATTDTTYSELKDLCQQFYTAYRTPNNELKEHDILLRKVQLFGGDYVPTFTPNNKREREQFERTTTERQLANRVAWESMTAKAQRKAIRHLTRVKLGQRAVNAFIRGQKKGGSQWEVGKMKSIDFITTKGEKITVKTRNAYAKTVGDVARIRLLSKYAHLTANQSRFLNWFASDLAIIVGETARHEYWQDNYESYKADGHLKEFYNSLANAELKARRKFAFNQIGIVDQTRQSKIIKQLENNLRPFYNNLQNLYMDGETADTEHSNSHERPLKRQNERVSGKAWAKHEEPTPPTAKQLERWAKARKVAKEHEEQQANRKPTKSQRKPISEWNTNAVEVVDRHEYTALWLRLLAERDNESHTEPKPQATPIRKGARFYNPHRTAPKQNHKPSGTPTDPIELLGKKFTI